jgi:DNA-directed RNA polymerase specialized sigma24 family protein
MTEDAFNVPGGLTIRDLRRDRTLAPGGGRFPEVVRRFLPLVYGISSALIPENPAAAETVSTAVFETLAFRWRRPRRTLIATWLVRTTCFAAARERRRLGLKAKAGTAAGLLAQRLFKEVNHLAPRYANAVVLCSFLKEAPENAAAALRTNTVRVEKRNRKAVARLTKRMQKLGIKLRKLGPLELPEMGLIGWRGGSGRGILSRLAGWRSNAEKNSLVRGAVSSMAGAGSGRFCKRLRRSGRLFACW